MVLDGEMIIADENGKSDFQALQNYLKKPTGKELTFIVFDLLAADGKDLRDLPLSERKSALEKLMKGAPSIRRLQQTHARQRRGDLSSRCKNRSGRHCRQKTQIRGTVERRNGRLDQNEML